MSAVVVTGMAQRQAWRDNVLPPVERVRPGLWSVPVPIPDNPLRYVLVHLLELDEGVAVVDTGWNTAVAWQALVDGLAVAGYAVEDVRAALVTHIHPDHYGLAGRLREASGAVVALHPADAALLPGRYGAGIDALVAQMRELLGDCGVPTPVTAELSEASMGLREFVSQGEPDIFLEHGRRLDLPGWDVVALHTPGHSPGHVCFLDRRNRLLLSGDHVLPRISPNISVHTQQPANPLLDYLASLRAVRDLHVEEVLPAHEWRFTPLAARVDELIAHHDERLAMVERVVRERRGVTCWDVTRALPWSRPWDQVVGHMRRAAVGETLAHLVLLESRGVLARSQRPWEWSALDSASAAGGPARPG